MNESRDHCLYSAVTNLLSRVIEQVERKLSTISSFSWRVLGRFEPYESISTEGTRKTFWGTLQPMFSMPMANFVNNCAKMAPIS